jgi:hypothetical protein
MVNLARLGDVAEWMSMARIRAHPKEGDLSNTQPPPKMCEAHGDVAEWSKAPHC